MSTFHAFGAGATELVDDSSLITGCSATVDGTGASANNGTVTAKYSNGTGKLSTTGAGNLHIYNVHGCADLVNSGDASSFVGSYAVSPKQTITSP
jgi:hypothetical protein